MLTKLFKNIKLRHLQKVYKDVEDIQTANIILKTIFALLAAFLVVIGIAIYSGDKSLIIIIIVGGFLLAVPTILLYRGQLRISSVILVMIVVTTMTISAILGQGIHDIAILAYPTAIFFANLVLQRHDFYLLSFFILAAMGYLGIGEAYGWFIPNPYKDSVAVDLILAEVILLISIRLADSLIENVRKSMNLARKEIALRKKAQEKLRHLNIHDDLTGIYNRAFFDEMLILMERSRKYPVSIIFADIDNLKEVNDKNGHAFGDDLLKRTSETLVAALREGDILARVGGDEFAVILPQTDSETANQILLRLRSTLDEHNIKHSEKPIYISFGTATAKKGDLKEAVKIADQRMYGDKENRKLK